MPEQNKKQYTFLPIDANRPSRPVFGSDEKKTSSPNRDPDEEKSPSLASAWTQLSAINSQKKTMVRDMLEMVAQLERIEQQVANLPKP